MDAPPDILCIGSVLWDVIGRSPAPMRLGNDVPGEIDRVPGGVALNIAVTIARLGMRPALLTAVGDDAEGDELLAACAGLGLVTRFAHRPAGLPTDRYMAVEGANGLIAAVADARTLEAAGSRILNALADGRLGGPGAPWTGAVALDGNLTLALLEEIAASPMFAAADLRVAPASPGKAHRLRPMARHPRATLYVNREEAEVIAGREFSDALSAATGLVADGVRRVLVTDGAAAAAEADDQGARRQTSPPRVRAKRVTGAGDTFMAAHVAAEIRGTSAQEALTLAARAAATHVSGSKAEGSR